MKILRILRIPDDATGGGSTQPPPGGTPPLNDFVKSLPADLQAEKSLHNMDNPVTLAKSYVHAQKMIGAKRLAAPEPTWGDKEWGQFADEIGRPKTAADYKVPEYKFESDPNLRVDAARIEPVKAALHEAGLTQRQVDKVLTTYFKSVDSDLKTARQQGETKRLEAETALKSEWGDKFDANMNLAKAVVTKFGDEKFMAYINEQGGNDPRLIKSLSRIGAAMLEDKSRGGSAADSLQITDQTRATQEIDRLKIDKDFQASMTNKSHPGHKAAVQQWLNLHKVATPGQQVE